MEFPINFERSRTAEFSITNKVAIRKEMMANLLYGIKPGREFRRFMRNYERMRRIRVKNGYSDSNGRLRLLAAISVLGRAKRLHITEVETEQ